MDFEVNIIVALKKTVNDPQGSTVTSSLKNLGFTNIMSTRIGKYITLYLTADSEEAAKKQGIEMCEKLLSNPVLESYTVNVKKKTK